MRHAAILRLLWLVFTGITCRYLISGQASTAIWTFVLSVFCLLQADIVDLNEGGDKK